MQQLMMCTNIKNIRDVYVTIFEKNLPPPVFPIVLLFFLFLLTKMYWI